MDYDRFSRDDEIGEVEVPLCDISLQKEPVDFVRELRPCKNATGKDFNDYPLLVAKMSQQDIGYRKNECHIGRYQFEETT